MHPSKGMDRIKRPSEEAKQAEYLKKQEGPDHYVSDSFTDPSDRGGPESEDEILPNEMPEGGDSTRKMTQGPASKSPLPTRKPA